VGAVESLVNCYNFQLMKINSKLLKR